MKIEDIIILESFISLVSLFPELKSDELIKR